MFTLKKFITVRHIAIHPPQNTPPHFKHTYPMGQNFDGDEWQCACYHNKFLKI